MFNAQNRVTKCMHSTFVLTSGHYVGADFRATVPQDMAAEERAPVCLGVFPCRNPKRYSAYLVWHSRSFTGSRCLLMSEWKK